MHRSPMTKYLLILLLAGFAALEFFHHLADGRAVNDVVCVDPALQSQAGRELLREHLRSHR